jgi:antitoxin ParD1/3/4
MATMTVSLPEQMKDWIEGLARTGEYSTTSDYVRDLVRRDKERRGQELTLDELRQLVADAKASGTNNRKVDDIFHEAQKIVAARRGGVGA